MKIEELGVNEVKPYEKNPRRNDRAVDGVAESIRQFGFKQPIVVDADNVIVAGHTRYKAAKKLGLKSIPCVRADDLTADQIKAYRIADNKLNELSTWDFELLTGELQSFEFDFEPLGFAFPNYDKLVEERKKEKRELTDTHPLEERTMDSQFAKNAFRYGLYIECENESQQQMLYQQLLNDGYSVKTTLL